MHVFIIHLTILANLQAYRKISVELLSYNIKYLNKLQKNNTNNTQDINILLLEHIINYNW